MNPVIYQNDFLNLQLEKSEIPWIKIFTNTPYKELTDCDTETKQALYKTMEAVERVMRRYYCPEKINIAMFGNYVPHVHVHVMARFKEDSFFPESMWGKKQRESHLELPPMEGFLVELTAEMIQLFHH